MAQVGPVRTSLFAEFNASVQSWINHVRYADSWGLRRQVLDRFDLAGRSLRSRAQ